jgi:hypothetical protein
VPSQPKGEARSKTDKNACPEHAKLRSEPAQIMLRCGGDIAAPQRIAQL